MKKITFILLVMTGCVTPPPTAQEVVDLSIQYSGTEVLKNAVASFKFREIDYAYERQNGQYLYTRTQRDTSGNVVKDYLNNDGLVRTINGDTDDITDEKRAAYTSSVNSVIYFAFLPLWLNDAAVNKSHEGIIEINGKNYHKIRVTFDQEGGGEDFEDIFYYWFDTEDYSMDYLAYSYNEEDEGTGIRFRVAYNSRKVNGVTIQDYRNLKPKVKDSVPLDQIDQAFMDGQLTELSLIKLENVAITVQ
ncbi:DUF6503 family protein [Ekhidna sp.]|uniref:DUF6503 family protein n=1 Tax=Ekhidna sp. TaxID=2608089 RepID=UPI003513DD75